MPPLEPPREAEIGRRLTVRHRLADGSAEDVVGRLLTVQPRLRLQRRDGSEIEVDPARVIVWRVVPDRPKRRRPAESVTAETLQPITSRGWPAVTSEPLGQWELRASDGFTLRANSVAVQGSPRVPISQALARVEAFYAEHHLPPVAQTIEGTEADAELIAHGWVPLDGPRPGAIVQVANLPQPDVNPWRADPEVEIAPHASDAWLAGYLRAEDPAAARAVLEAPATVGFLSLEGAIGRVVVTGEWAGIAAVEVPADRRRRGLGRRLVTTALAWAVEHGADKAYLQTMRDNEAALALYAPFGFTDHHAYRYLAPRSTP